MFRRTSFTESRLPGHIVAVATLLSVAWFVLASPRIGRAQSHAAWPGRVRTAATENAPTTGYPSTSTPSAWNLNGLYRNTVGAILGGAEEVPSPASPAVPFAAQQPQVISLPQPADPGQVRVENENELVSLMVRDGSLRHVIALVAETQRLNIVFATPADTIVTASFDRVPWQQVIDSLLSASGHSWTVAGGVIIVTSVADAKLLAPGASGLQTQVFELNFSSATDVDQVIQGLISPAGNSWVMESSPADNRRTREAVVVVDYPANLARINGYICQIDQPPRQVLIEANILQIDLQDDRRSGINFEAIASFAGNDLTFSPVGFANAAASPAFFLEVSGTALTGLVELLKNTTDAKTLASPKLLALNGQQAHIQIGEQLGFRITTTTQTSSLESVQFLDVGIILTVTPRITRDGRVLMRIKPKVSTGEVNPGNRPAVGEDDRSGNGRHRGQWPGSRHRRVDSGAGHQHPEQNPLAGRPAVCGRAVSETASRQVAGGDHRDAGSPCSAVHADGRVCRAVRFQAGSGSADLRAVVQVPATVRAQPSRHVYESESAIDSA